MDNKNILSIQEYPFYFNGIMENGSKYTWPEICASCTIKNCLNNDKIISTCSHGFSYIWISDEVMLGGILIRKPNESTAEKKNTKKYHKNITKKEKFESIANKISYIVKQQNELKANNLPANEIQNTSTHDFMADLGEKIDKAFSTLHEYKSFVSAIVKNINVIIEERHSGSDFESKLNKSNKNEKAIYYLSRMMDGKLRNAAYIHNKDSIKDKSKYVRFRFHGLLHKYLKIYEVVFTSKQIHLSNKFSSEEELFTNSDALSVIIQNLIDNAYKYAPHESNVHITCIDTIKGIQISIKSLGPKITNHDKIYMPSHREKEAEEITTEGTGFGLFISKHIANDLGIKLEHSQDATSQNNMFYETTFSMLIPPHLFACNNM